MRLSKLAEKLTDYKERLELGKAEEIKPGHVKRVLKKLRNKVSDLEAEVSTEKKADKKARLTRKLGIARKQVERAQWLLRELD